MPRHLKSFAALVLTAELCSVLPLHAAPAYITNPIPVRVTHVTEWFRPTTSRLCFTALSVDPYYIPPTTNQLASGVPLRSQLLPVASWTLPNGASGLPANVALVTRGKNIVSGNYILECWLDLNDDSKFNPGEPYGCEMLYGLATTNKIERLGIELMEVSPVIARIDIADLIDAMPATTNSAPPFQAVATSSDRYVWSVPYGGMLPETTCGTNKPNDSTYVVRVRIVRDSVSGSTGNALGESFSEVIIDRFFDLSNRHVLTEADVLCDGFFDLDWLNLRSKWVAGGAATPAGLTNASYRIVIGDGSPGEYESDGNNLPVKINNIFERSLNPGNTYNNYFHVDDGFPVFSWSQTNSIDKPYPAFRLRIYQSSDITLSNVLHDTGILRAPPRSTAGIYEYKLPLRVGDPMYKYTGEEKVLTGYLCSDSNYWWSVSMLDSKFKSFSSGADANSFVMPPATNSATLYP